MNQINPNIPNSGDLFYQLLSDMSSKDIDALKITLENAGGADVVIKIDPNTFRPNVIKIKRGLFSKWRSNAHQRNRADRITINPETALKLYLMHAEPIKIKRNIKNLLTKNNIGLIIKLLTINGIDKTKFNLIEYNDKMSCFNIFIKDYKINFIDVFDGFIKLIDEKFDGENIDSSLKFIVAFICAQNGNPYIKKLFPYEIQFEIFSDLLGIEENKIIYLLEKINKRDLNNVNDSEDKKNELIELTNNLFYFKNEIGNEKKLNDLKTKFNELFKDLCCELKFDDNEINLIGFFVFDYIERIKQNSGEHRLLLPENRLQLIVAAIILAHKFIFDKPYGHTSFAYLFKLPIDLINKSEIELLQLLGHNANVSEKTQMEINKAFPPIPLNPPPPQ